MSIFRRSEKSYRTVIQESSEKERGGYYAFLKGLVNDDAFKMNLALELHKGYCAREIQRRQAAGEPIDSYLNQPLLDERQQEIFRDVARLSPADRKALKRQLAESAPVPHTLDELGQATQQNELELFALFDQIVDIRGKALAPLPAFLDSLSDFRDRKSAREFLQRILSESLDGKTQKELCKLVHRTWLQSEIMLGRDINDRQYPIWEELPPEEKLKDWDQVQDIARIFLQAMDQNASN